MVCFRTRCFHDWDCAVRYVKALSGDQQKRIFRGREDWTWGLKSTLEREFESFAVRPWRRVDVERKMLREFQRCVHHYTANIPGEHATDEWLALMQHYGGPTRLLDWTYSFYVASFFAFEKAQACIPIAVWALNTEWLHREVKAVFKRNNRRDLLHPRCMYKRKRSPGMFKQLYMSEDPIRFVDTVNPFRLVDRLRFQRGVFLCSGDVSASFECNLKSLEGYDSEFNVVKIVIDTGNCGELRTRALEELADMNINRASLFPGLEGFAESLKTKIPLFVKQEPHLGMH